MRTSTTSRNSGQRRQVNEPLESTEQIRLFQWIDYAKGKHPELNLAFHIPNGGSRNKIEAHNLKLQGVRSGVPDIFLAVPRGRYCGLFVEMKRKKSGSLSENQKGWISALNRAGYKAVVCHGFESAQKTIIDYLNEEL